MNKKIVVLGGGTGMSALLKGLKEFPVDLSAIVSVCDDGKSTGKLREEFGTVAVGDVRKVLVALSATKESELEQLLDYRFITGSGLNGHTVGNILLVASNNIYGNLSNGIEALSKFFALKGKVIPLTEENVHLVAQMEDGTVIEGEHHITAAKKSIENIYYKEDPKPTPEAIQAISEADIIILSMGSIFTSVVPNLIIPEIIQAIDESKAPILYACNIMTQPGETDEFKVSNHINLLNHYLGNKKISYVVANNSTIDEEIRHKYETAEQKDPVILDPENIDPSVTIIADDYLTINNELIRHDSIRIATDIFSLTLNLNRGTPYKKEIKH